MPFFTGLFARALDGVNVKELITNIGSSAGSAPAAGGAAPAAAAGGAAPAKEGNNLLKSNKNSNLFKVIRL